MIWVSSRRTLLVGLFGISLFGWSAAQARAPATPEEARAIAKEA